jgi:hypothetical protein
LTGSVTVSRNWTRRSGRLPIDGFSAVFVGNGNAIANLYINRAGAADTGCTGLFGSARTESHIDTRADSNAFGHCSYGNCETASTHAASVRRSCDGYSADDHSCAYRYACYAASCDRRLWAFDKSADRRCFCQIDAASANMLILAAPFSFLYALGIFGGKRLIDKG